MNCTFEERRTNDEFDRIIAREIGRKRLCDSQWANVYDRLRSSSSSKWFRFRGLCEENIVQWKCGVHGFNWSNASEFSFCRDEKNELVGICVTPASTCGVLEQFGIFSGNFSMKLLTEVVY